MVIAALISAILTLQPPAMKGPPGRYVLLRVNGDLDSQRLIASISEELEKAQDSGLVILELDGNCARPDLVGKLGNRLKTNPVPVAILLKDPVDRKVGLGQVVLGAYASACYVDTATEVEWTPDADLRWQAPADVSWEAVERENSGVLWSRLKDLQADVSLSQVLTNPAQDWWAVPGAQNDAWRLSPIAPAGGQSGPEPRQIVRTGHLAPAKITLDEETLVGLRLCAAKVQSVAPILKKAGLPAAASRTSRSISSGLADATASMSRTIDDAKLGAKKIATTLTIKTSGPRAISSEDYRQAGRSALEQVDRVQRELERADKLLADYPELEHRRDQGIKKGARGPWRSEIDGLRRELDRLRTTARDFSSR